MTMAVYTNHKFSTITEVCATHDKFKQKFKIYVPSTTTI